MYIIFQYKLIYILYKVSTPLHPAQEMTLSFPSDAARNTGHCRTLNEQPVKTVVFTGCTCSILFYSPASVVSKIDHVNMI